MQGFHSTGTMGVFGAVAAAAQLRGLNPEQTRFALGIAASKGAGLRANFGTMTKPYHAGAAAENGVVAARLAGLGYQADPNALDGQWGFFQVTGGGAEPERVLGRLGAPYTLEWPGVSVKPYPCGSLAHPTMDALLDLLTSHDVAPEQVEEVRLGGGKEHPAASALPVAPVRPGGEVQSSVLPGDSGATPSRRRPRVHRRRGAEAPRSGR